MPKPELPRIAILASGNGTTAEYVIHATQTGVLQAEIALVISNNSNAGVFSLVDALNKQYGLHIIKKHISGRTHPEGAGNPGEQTLQESSEIARLCQTEGIVLLSAQGYAKKIRGVILELLIDKVNNHPAPLPETAGLVGEQAAGQVLELQMPFSGITIHDLAEDYDTGRIRAFRPTPVMPGDTPKTLFVRTQVTEKVWTPPILNGIVQGEL